jgi:peptidoglycan/xylan/chitin deacetylase (PgdA/CDA1 family)
MFFDQDLKGNRLPPKTLCLTYDDGPGKTDGDGPGPRTRALGRFLHSEGVAATFFVVGQHAEGHAETLRLLKSWGHWVGNHTYSHPGLVALTQAGGDVVGEIARTDALIRDDGGDGVTWLRAPYGNWREKKSPKSDEDRPVSIVADALQRSGRFGYYIGPVNWDISAADYDHWRRGAGAEECAAAYLAKIEARGRGIILMHDSSEEEAVRAQNRTFEATQLLVPALKARGYRFIRLDEVPQVRSAVTVRDQVRLETADGRFVRRAGADDDHLVIDAVTEEDGEVFGVVPLEGKRLALRASHGQFLSLNESGLEFLANGPEPGAAAVFEMQAVGNGAFALRAANGRYLCRARGSDRLVAAAPSRRSGERFQFRKRFGE